MALSYEYALSFHSVSILSLSMTHPTPWPWWKRWKNMDRNYSEYILKVVYIEIEIKIKISSPLFPSLLHHPFLLLCSALPSFHFLTPPPSSPFFSWLYFYQWRHWCCVLYLISSLLPSSPLIITHTHRHTSAVIWSHLSLSLSLHSGTGVVCCNPKGIAPHVMVSEYLGEIYPPYRW